MRIDSELQDVAEFWSQRYRSEGFIWGKDPSRCARAGVSRFRSYGAREVLVLGCGYGRDAKYMAEEGLQVTAVDFAAGALELADQWDAKEGQSTVNYALDNIVDLGFNASRFDAVFSHRTLHLLLSHQRLEQGLAEISRVLKPGGIACLSVRSHLDPTKGRSVQGSKQAYELSFRPGHKVLFLTESELRRILDERFTVLDFQEMAERESCTQDYDVKLHFVALKKIQVD